MNLDILVQNLDAGVDYAVHVPYTLMEKRLGLV